jgi:phosphatidate cytidylyltransferase
MSKKVYKDDVKNEEKIIKEKVDNAKDDKSDNKDTSDAGASGFSDEAEKEFQEKKKGKMAKLHNVVSKGLIPPKSDQQGKKGKWNDLKIRVKWSLLMASLFYLILFAGHIYSSIMVAVIAISIFYELIDLSIFKERNAEIKNYHFICWYILTLGLYFSYIRILKDKISFLTQYTIFYYLLKYHKFICFMLYCLGFLLFLTSLRKGHYKYQFRQFAYIHIIFMIFGYVSSMIISNIFSGLIWFLLPVSCVVINDISAYFWGKSFGKHSLSTLSPNKTWEGFIGAFFSTLVWCYFFTKLLARYKIFLCPAETMTIVPFKLNSSCDVSELLKEYEFSFSIFNIVFTFSLSNIQFHSLSVGLFASSIAPLGGLFASGFKRSNKIKDFANTIPGHGGVTDRMDCQMLNGAFVYIYLKQFVFYDGAKIMDNILKKIMRLNHEEQLAIYEKLKLILGQ